MIILFYFFSNTKVNCQLNHFIKGIFNIIKSKNLKNGITNLKRNIFLNGIPRSDKRKEEKKTPDYDEKAFDAWIDKYGKLKTFEATLKKYFANLISFGPKICFFSQSVLLFGVKSLYN